MICLFILQQQVSSSIDWPIVINFNFGAVLLHLLDWLVVFGVNESTY